MFNVGQKVRLKIDPSVYGEVCAVSYSQRTVRVILQNPLGKIWWYDVNELENYE